MKRARQEALASHWMDNTRTVVVDGRLLDADVREKAIDAGQKFRFMILSKFASGAFNAEELVELAWWHSHSYGLGVDDIRCDPSTLGYNLEAPIGIDRSNLHSIFRIV